MGGAQVEVSGADRVRYELVRTGKRMLADGLVIGSSGNLSVRVGGQMFITPSGVPYDLMVPTDICCVDIETGGCIGSGRPSSEAPMHRMVYGSSNAKAIVHAHSTAAIAVSITCLELPAVHYSILQLGGATVRVAPYKLFGSDDLATAAASALSDRTGALLQNHGTITYGQDLTQAYFRAQMLEWMCDIYVRSHVLGSPRILSEQELNEVASSSRARQYGHLRS